MVNRTKLLLQNISLPGKEMLQIQMFETNYSFNLILKLQYDHEPFFNHFLVH